MKNNTAFNKTPLLLAMNLAAGLASGLAIAAGDLIVTEGDLYIPNMPSQSTGAPVCIDAFSGQLVANCDAAAGPVGPTGPTGATGDTGPQGVQGPTGPQGLQGNTGPQGLPGSTGPQGIQGPIGPQGLQGQAGAQGIQGPTGPQGIQGPIGPQGLQGTTGLAGPQGPVGPTGAQGIQGPVGPQGIQGPAGIDGIQGDTGAQGIQGSTGPQGIAGVTGPEGPSAPVYLSPGFDVAGGPLAPPILGAPMYAVCDPGDTLVGGGVICNTPGTSGGIIDYSCPQPDPLTPCVGLLPGTTAGAWGGQCSGTPTPPVVVEIYALCMDITP